MDCKSVANQEIKRKFVARNVYCCVSNIVDYILRQDDTEAPFTEAPFTWEDIENLCRPVCPECGNPVEVSDSLLGTNYYCDFCNEEVDPEEEQQEVFEWWIVSPWLTEELAARGEPGIRHMNIWGRTCTGQAILLDDVITEICSDMQILEGHSGE